MHSVLQLDSAPRQGTPLQQTDAPEGGPAGHVRPPSSPPDASGTAASSEESGPEESGPEESRLTPSGAFASTGSTSPSERDASLASSSTPESTRTVPSDCASSALRDASSPTSGSNASSGMPRQPLKAIAMTNVVAIRECNSTRLALGRRRGCCDFQHRKPAARRVPVLTRVCPALTRASVDIPLLLARTKMRRREEAARKMPSVSCHRDRRPFVSSKCAFGGACALSSTLRSPFRVSTSGRGSPIAVHAHTRGNGCRGIHDRFEAPFVGALRPP